MRMGWRIAFPALLVDAGSLERIMALALSKANLGFYKMIDLGLGGSEYT